MEFSLTYGIKCRDGIDKETVLYGQMIFYVDFLSPQFTDFSWRACFMDYTFEFFESRKHFTTQVEEEKEIYN